METRTNEQKYQRLRDRWLDQPDIRKLIDSGALTAVVNMLKDKRRIQPFETERLPLDIWVVGAVSGALAPPDVAEMLTASERARLAKTICDSASQLSGALSEFQSESGMRWPFQPILDRLALELIEKEKAHLRDAGFPMEEEVARRCESSIFRFLMEDLDLLFDSLIESAEWFARTETVLKKPNDTNAERLYFIRMLNRKFCVEFRSPCRSAVLALASVYFDCSDLDDAALSKLAPFYKPTPVSIPKEQMDFMVKFHAAQGDDSWLERLQVHMDAESKWGMGRKNSAE